MIDLPYTELLTQLAEEAAELAQAALKLRRALDGTNPTPKSQSECRENLLEEIADVRLCSRAVMGIGDNIKVLEYMDHKRERWAKRLSEVT